MKVIRKGDGKTKGEKERMLDAAFCPLPILVDPYLQEGMTDAARQHF